MSDPVQGILMPSAAGAKVRRRSMRPRGHRTWTRCLMCEEQYAARPSSLRGRPGAFCSRGCADLAAMLAARIAPRAEGKHDGG